ncbi:hypothetical protein LRY29_01545 [Candidatus Saccharibacteria bacterium]|nr:hypothetical protein [Candidatus Saccharibacteria bacterium]
MELLILITLLVIAAETTYLASAHVWKRQRTVQAPVFVDTSALIDGRIIAIAESGFLSRTLYIPRSVVGELQFLADNADTEKRTRARHGLDVISELQAISSVSVEIFSDGTRAKEGVDNRLLSLAKKYKGSICTIDYNLNKVAAVEGTEVLNVNELAKSLRMAYLPGEKTRIELTQKGNDNHQAVGHLADGTMVVVERASKYIGSAVEIEFIRSLQTAAGKMMFAKLSQSSDQQPQQKSERARQPKTTGRSVSKAVQTSQKSQQPETRSDSKATRSSTQPRQGSRRRRSPEDALVELANQ